jgi:formate dehydrogenase beta subunit
MLIEALRDAQKVDGWLSPDALQLVALRAGVTLAQVQEVASFFPEFRLAPMKRPVLRVCQSMVCHLKWGTKLKPTVRAWLEKRAGLSCDDRHTVLQQLRLARRPERVDVLGVSCLGRCDRAPVALLETPAHEETLFTGLDPGRLEKLLAGQEWESGKDLNCADRGHDAPKNAWDGVHIYHEPTKRCSYQAISDYKARDDRATDDAGRARWRNELLDLIERAKLFGMGGAAAGTARKWRDVRDAKDRTKYVVCNGDESEPGTFKDRELLLRYPGLVIEGVLLACLLLKAHRTYIYVRHEYAEQIKALDEELAAIRGGRRNDAVKAVESRHPVVVVKSPGRYICGEETALLEVIEGKRAQPRNNPLELIRDRGLFGHPTVVNNVETFAWVPGIALEKAPKPIKRFFSVSGDVETPGVFEMSVEDTLRNLLELAGGDPKNLRAVAPSGPSGFLPARFSDKDGQELRRLGQLAAEKMRSDPRRAPEADRVEKFFADWNSPYSVLNFHLDAQLFRAVGLSLGAGIAFYAESATNGDMRTHATNCLEFYRDESCGKCTPCRLGTQQLVQLGNPRDATDEQITFAEAVAETMKATSICGLGRAAPRPLETWLKYFRDGTRSGGA